jgi:hypothetical protein
MDSIHLVLPKAERSGTWSKYRKPILANNGCMYDHEERI